MESRVTPKRSAICPTDTHGSVTACSKQQGLYVAQSRNKSERLQIYQVNAESPWRA
jgi:hypothetical protein